MRRPQTRLPAPYLRRIWLDRDAVPDPDAYPWCLPFLREAFELSFDTSITIIVGENGTGKSTLLEAIAVAYGFNPEGGTRNYNFSTYDSHSELCNAIRLSRGFRRAGWGYFLRAESFYNVATKEEEYSREGGVMPEYYHHKSHGESFLALAQKSFKANGLYLLDPLRGGLIAVDSGAELEHDMHYAGNRNIYSGSAFSLYFVYNAEYSMPKYGSRSYYYAMLDAGILIGTLNLAAAEHGMGCCSIGDLNFRKAAGAFRLNGYQQYLHCMIFGKPAAES